MKALVYHRSVPRYLLARMMGQLFRRRFFPSLAPLSLEEIPANEREGWITVRNRLCGICGSDINLLRGQESYLMEPYGTFPFVLGHEIVAEVIDAPSGSDWKAGDRVAVDPFLGCEVRGLAPCHFCARGDYNLCENLADGRDLAGVGVGYTAGVDGGMAEQAFLHPGRLIGLPDSVDDQKAVLVDSLASALRPILRHYPADDSVVVVCGLGIIGQHVVRGLRSLGSKARIIGIARHDFQKDSAIKGGADEVLLRPDRRALAKAVGGRFLKSTLGGGNIEGGANMFFDCVGSASSIQEGLLALRARGNYVLVGTAGQITSLDLSPLWSRELNVSGSAYAGKTEFRGETVRVHELAVKLLADDPERWSDLETRVLPMSEYREAFRVAFDKRQFHCMKVALDPHA